MTRALPTRSALLAALAGAGCANNSGSTTVACQALTPGPASPPPQWSGTVFTIAMENHSRGEILGNPAAPFINSLAAHNAVAAGYRASFVHPSEPNYLALTT